MEMYFLFAALLVAFALGGVFVAMLAGSGSPGTIMVVPSPAPASDAGVGCALVVILAVAAFIVLLLMCGNLPPGGL